MQINGIGHQANHINPSSSNKAESLMEKLASGKKVNSAADDAAGLAIINRLSAELDGYLRGAQNGYDGVSVAQTAEGTYSEIGDSVARIEELTAQAGNGALNSQDRQAIQTQIDGLTEHIGETVSNASFGGVKLLESAGSIGITLGGSSSIDIQTKDANADLDGFGLNSIDVTSAAGRAAAQTTLESASEYINTSRAELGATQNRLDSSIRNLHTQHENVSAARSRRQDTDFAQASSERARNDILQQAQISIQAQSNLNRGQALNLLG